MNFETKDFSGLDVTVIFGEDVELVQSDWNFNKDEEAPLIDISFTKGEELEVEVLNDRGPDFDLQLSSGSILWRVPKKIFDTIRTNE